MRFYFGEKRALLKGLNRMRLWFKLAEISGEMEREDMMEKLLRVFRARLHVVLTVRSRLAVNIIAPWVLDGLTL